VSENVFAGSNSSPKLKKKQDAQDQGDGSRRLAILNQPFTRLICSTKKYSQWLKTQKYWNIQSQNQHYIQWVIVLENAQTLFYELTCACGNLQSRFNLINRLKECETYRTQKIFAHTNHVHNKQLPQLHVPFFWYGRTSCIVNALSVGFQEKRATCVSEITNLWNSYLLCNLCFFEPLLPIFSWTRVRV